MFLMCDILWVYVPTRVEFGEMCAHMPYLSQWGLDRSLSHLHFVASDLTIRHVLF